MLISIVVAIVGWFFVAAALFFNPFVSKIYDSESGHPAVKVLPPSPKTISKILGAITLQVLLWAIVYQWVSASLPSDNFLSILIFGTIISFVKIIPRDVDRILLTSYPPKRMGIEFVVGIICAYVVAAAFVLVA